MAINKGKNSEKLERKVINQPPVFFLRPDVEPIKYKNRANNIAILVSKKNFPTAVLRNRAKRRIKEAVSKAINNLNLAESGIFLKINAQKPVNDVQFQDLVEIIIEELRKRY